MKAYAEDIKQCIASMRSGGVILYPTDTVWGLGCDATSVDAIRKIADIKGGRESKNFILLLDHASRLASYVREIPDQAWNLIDYAERPLTIIYDGARNLPEELIAPDGSIAIRITRDEFCRDLVAAMRKPLVSTSANISGQPAPSIFNKIDAAILAGADYAVGWRRNDLKEAQPSTIIRLRSDGQFSFVRR